MIRRILSLIDHPNFFSSYIAVEFSHDLSRIILIEESKNVGYISDPNIINYVDKFRVEFTVSSSLDNIRGNMKPIWIYKDFLEKLPEIFASTKPYLNEPRRAALIEHIENLVKIYITESIHTI